jgi:uncharacterized SAM-binding protein YcdF (DUF218 family)
MSHLLLSPLTWLLLIAALLWAGWRKLPGIVRVLGVVSLACLVLLCTPLLANGLIRHVESGVPERARCIAPAGAQVVVLAGGFDRAPRDADDYAALSPESWRRLRGAVDLVHRHPGSRLMIAGGGIHATKESEVLAGLARDWGVAAAAVSTESRSATTWENASELRAGQPAPVPDDVIWLVTSALHMPRAVIAFERAGFTPCAHPSGSDQVAMDGWGYFVPQARAADKTHRALYELVGQARYRFRSQEGD